MMSQMKPKFMLKAMGEEMRRLGVATFAVLALTSAAQAATDEIVYFHTDALGSPVAAFSEAGDVCWGETYAPYGEKLDKEDQFAPESGCGLLRTDVGYTGHVQDSSGLVYAQQRYYDPVIGRFLSTDPVKPNAGDPRYFGRYQYGANSPYRFTDPNGMSFLGYSSSYSLDIGPGTAEFSRTIGVDFSTWDAGVVETVSGGVVVGDEVVEIASTKGVTFGAGKLVDMAGEAVAVGGQLEGNLPVGRGFLSGVLTVEASVSTDSLSGEAPLEPIYTVEIGGAVSPAGSKVPADISLTIQRSRYRSFGEIIRDTYDYIADGVSDFFGGNGGDPNENGSSSGPAIGGSSNDWVVG